MKSKYFPELIDTWIFTTLIFLLKLNQYQLIFINLIMSKINKCIDNI